MAARQTSRSARKEALLAEARACTLPQHCSVCVVGGGAAGLVAAICAAEQGARTVMLERDLECGRKLLATGGGRCNFANRDLSPAHYNNPGFVEAVAGDDFLHRVLAFFRASGLAWSEENGWLFPHSYSAASVRDVLVARAQRAGVICACAREVTQIEQSSTGWQLHVAGPSGAEVLGADAVILAAGGKSDAFGLMLNTHPAEPILCPLACTGLPFKQLDGQRAHVAAQLVRRDKLIAREDGEILFRPYGISGICAFNLSRHAQAADELILDLAPTLDTSQLSYLAARADSYTGIVSPQIAASLKEAGFEAQDLKSLRCRVSGHAEIERAQVSRGGLATSGFDPSTLAAVAQPGIFAAGEALNIDGPCGGYNLAWAWISGQVAGTAAARWALDPEARGTHA